MKISLDRFVAFIFDFDGVIVDSLEVKEKAFGELFKAHGETVRKQVMNFYRNNGGISRYEQFRYYYKHFLGREITDDIVRDLDRRCSELLVEQVLQCPLIEGIQELLTDIRSLNKDCFVISGTPQEEMRHIIKRRGLDPFFKDVLGSPKNKKENVRIVLEQHSIKPAEAIFFGDAKSDYEAARENRIQFIGIVDKSAELENFTNITKIKNFKNVFSLGE